MGVDRSVPQGPHEVAYLVLVYVVSICILEKLRDAQVNHIDLIGESSKPHSSIMRLNIFMDDTPRVQILKPCHHLLGYK